MKNKLLIPSMGLLALGLLLAAGCASAGNEHLRTETEASVAMKITEGRTTKAEIRSMFGSPDTTNFTDGGMEIWKYENTNLKADGANYIPIVNLFGSSYSGTKKELVILFDEQGLVKRYSMSEAATSVKSGVFK